jgi:holo-[acyl-carrier protein] synthase
MIVSTGVDLAEVDRIQAAIEHPRIGRRFRDRVFTVSEIAYCEKKQRGKYESYAGPFLPAKEAVMKALGRAGALKVRWLDIRSWRGRAAASRRSCYMIRRQTSPRAGHSPWALSITHTKQHGLAYCIAEDARMTAVRVQCYDEGDQNQFVPCASAAGSFSQLIRQAAQKSYHRAYVMRAISGGGGFFCRQ